MFSLLKNFIKNITTLLSPIRLKGINNVVNINCKYKNCYFKINGNNNKILIDESCLLSNTKIIINGNNCEVIIDKLVRFMGPTSISISDGGSLYVKENAGIRGVNMEIGGGKSIVIGSLCMFSYGITLRNYDSHKVIDLETHHISNKAEDIVLGNHVWICKNVTILKGVTVGDNSILGYGSIVTRDVPHNTIAAGIPAKIVKENITWDY